MADESNAPEESGGLSQPASRSSEEEGGGGAPEWMCTFADLVTLLMCFFVLLFAMSTTQQETFKELVLSLKTALGVQELPEAGTREGLIFQSEPVESKDEEAVDELGGLVQKEVEDIVSDVRELVMFNKLAGMVKVEENESGAKITISDVVLFGSGQTNMSPSGLDIMKKVAKVLVQFHYPIKIVGHTDNSPIKTGKIPSNWELSSNRACDVVRFLVKNGIKPSYLTAEGRAQYRPVATNTTNAGRAKNRRVEIIYERQNIAETLSD